MNNGVSYAIDRRLLFKEHVALRAEIFIQLTIICSVDAITLDSKLFLPAVCVVTFDSHLSTMPDRLVRDDLPHLRALNHYKCEHCGEFDAQLLCSYYAPEDDAEELDRQMCFKCVAALLLQMPHCFDWAEDKRQYPCCPIKHLLDQSPHARADAECAHPLKRQRTESRTFDHMCERCDAFHQAMSMQFTELVDGQEKHVSGDFCRDCAALFLIDLHGRPAKFYLKPGKTSIMPF